MKISNTAFQKLDRDHNQSINLQEIKNLDTNGDKKISQQEAAHQGISNSEDVNSLNSALKFFAGSSPVEIVFTQNKTLRSSADFSSDRDKTIIQKYGLHPSKGPKTLQTIQNADNNWFLVHQTMNTIQTAHPHIQEAARDFGVDARLLGAFIFEEQNHQFPPLIEDSIADLTETLNLKQNTSIGLSQLGVGELILQGHFEKNGISKNTPESKLPESLRAEGKRYLQDPRNNVRVLAKQVRRIQADLGYPNRPLDLNTFQGQHAAALIAYIHNGYADYSKRILAYVQNQQIQTAVSGQYVPKPEPAPQPR